MALMTIEDALARLLDHAPHTELEDIPLADGLDRVLAMDLHANRDQPPFDASAMDGYAIRTEDLATIPAKLQVVGEVPAGYRFPEGLGRWEAVRIFTGAPVPEGADGILIQENAERDGPFVTALEPVTKGQHIRKAGQDFKSGQRLLDQGTKLSPAHLALAASMNCPSLRVHKRPKLAILATGDELVLPGTTPSVDQIIASNNFGVAALARQAGADCLDLGIAPDNEDAIAAKINEAQQAGVDILVTSGGVSVGDHDLVQDVLSKQGMDLNFWRIAMRPGKPLMAGKLDGIQVLGLPGNPVSAMICALLFLRPLICKMQGLDTHQPTRTARLDAPLPANDKRQSYLRATLSYQKDGQLVAEPFSSQDSAMLTGLARAHCLIIRVPFAPQAERGDQCEVIPL